MTSTTLTAGIPAINSILYHRIRFLVGDPAAIITQGAPDQPKRTLIIRDIEMARARKHARADEVFCPADFTPDGGLSGDRETATAQATAECLRRMGVTNVRSDRSLPLIFADHVGRAGIGVTYDPDLGVLDRRVKDEQEIQWLREAQAITEDAMRMACETVARAQAASDGALQHEGAPLTSERLKYMIDVFLLERACDNPHGSTVTCGEQGGDCHDNGSGPLFTNQPVIIDIYPQVRATRYHGDCTRTVVHGEASPELRKMHETVIKAKAAAEAATRAGATGEQVHLATKAVITAAGYPMGLVPEGAAPEFTSMQHGTGHGIGLEVHEPPLLDAGGPALLAGEAVTIEPGLYSRAYGGVRVEDMVIVRDNGCENLDALPQGLAWA